ncbi:uncharacterized protein LOC141660169 [Apium graveolens]|uniref:uncharacterized protein LOC141660169 n=1 Tax=Apium graveolens TaxID=4045 RepID=UPI003D7AE65B
MKKNKALGPDGFTVEFYLAAWDTVDRLKHVMPHIINISQSAFVQGRQISDNIFMAQELFHGYTRVSGVPKCALKIDLHKAFDFLDWDFLMEAMHKKRQGDPISPYLFTIAMNVLSTLLSKTPHNFRFHWKCKSLKLIHIFYANDMLLFTLGDTSSITHAMQCLALFSSWSGLTASVDKSTVFFGGCSSDFVQWHFLLPSSVHATIQSIFTRLLWKGDLHNKGGAKVSLVHLCIPIEEGGVGLRNSKEWNKAQLLRHLCKVISNSPSLCALWINSTDLKNTLFWTLTEPSDCSWIWRKVLQLRPLARQFIRYLIGNGQRTSLWFDPWWNNTCLASHTRDPIISQVRSSPNVLVHSLIASGSWCLLVPSTTSRHTSPTLVAWLRDFSPTTVNLTTQDSITWDGVSLVKVKTWHIWDSIRRRLPEVPWHSFIWHKLTVTRYAYLE